MEWWILDERKKRCAQFYRNFDGTFGDFAGIVSEGRFEKRRLMTIKPIDRLYGLPFLLIGLTVLVKSLDLFLFQIGFLDCF